MPNVLLQSDESTDGTALVTDTADWPTHHRANQKPKGFLPACLGPASRRRGTVSLGLPSVVGLYKLHWLLFRGSRPFHNHAKR